MISLDPIHHKLVVGSKVVELQPLTFALFAKLHEHKNEVVSIATLTDEVWGNVTVSPDTLKQRIFLLRKALEEADIEDCLVQSVRGQGYRLVIHDEGQSHGGVSSGRRIPVAVGLLAVLSVIAIYVWQAREPYDPPPNSRVVFWHDSPTSFTHGEADRWEQMWLNHLSMSDKIIFVATERDPEQSLGSQARQERAALISIWTQFESDGEQMVRMQLLEPKTASTLRSDLVAMDDTVEMARLLGVQTAAVERILESGILPLVAIPLNETDHPAWARLRSLAADPD